MAFRVEISPRAFNDLDEISRYIKQQDSFEQAEEWHARPVRAADLEKRVCATSSTFRLLDFSTP